MAATESWARMKEAIRSGKAVALVVSPELYHEQVERLNSRNEPEHRRFPWDSIYGIPVIVNPNLEPDTFVVMQSRDFIDDMRIALDIYTDGMLQSETFKCGGISSDT